ncbi:hypothetical protein M8C21_033316 [Ambrosia artemisiifolia]|uniref:Uncharacterized protein n=1 Tax=Ambrosia artemisiifolia TaxID=4212 RepID=A0AAD5BVB2_AMBAR|nr:hypothetical protein M8C21_033316 [Ambrosia artemisiifolia]
MSMNNALQNPIITVMVLLSLLMVMYNPDHHLVLAASGGRMGGTSFRSSSSSSSRRTSTSSYSTSYSIPRFSYSRRFSTRTGGSPQSRSSKSLSTQISSPGQHVRYADEDHVETSVLKLQVGLLVTARSLQKDLNKIAETADTSCPKGFRYILKETTLSMLQHSDYCISAYSSVDVKRGEEECEKQFNKLSKEEKDKFDEETLVNFNNIRKQTATCHETVSEGLCNKYIVVTIIVAASGAHELPPIKTRELLVTAFQKLASFPSNKILAAEVLWTPQKEDDSLTEHRMLQDYPQLHPL